MRRPVWAGVTLAGLGVLLSAPAYAGFYSGKDLLDTCSVSRDSKTYIERNYECAAYVAGAVDAFNTTREVNKLKSCLPADVTMGQLRNVTVDYLLANPDKLTTSASTLVFAATRTKWPCTKAKAKATKSKKKARTRK